MCFLLVLENKRQAVTTCPPQLPEPSWRLPWPDPGPSGSLLLRSVSSGLTWRSMRERNCPKGAKQSRTGAFSYVTLSQSLNIEKSSVSPPSSCRISSQPLGFRPGGLVFCDGSWGFEEWVLWGAEDPVAGRERVPEPRTKSSEPAPSAGHSVQQKIVQERNIRMSFLFLLT